MPMPVVPYRTNSDFLGIDLPPSLQDARADHPGRFDDASYSEYEFLDVAMVLVLWEYRFDDDGGARQSRPSSLTARRTASSS